MAMRSNPALAMGRLRWNGSAGAQQSTSAYATAAVGIKRMFGRPRVALRQWRRQHAARRDLRRCALLDPRFASDIGLTQGDVVMAIRMRGRLAMPQPGQNCVHS